MKAVSLPIIEEKNPFLFKSLWGLVFISIIFHIIFAGIGGFQNVEGIIHAIFIGNIFGTFILGFILTYIKEHRKKGELIFFEDKIKIKEDNSPIIKLDLNQIQSINIDFNDFKGEIKSINPLFAFSPEKGINNNIQIQTVENEQYSFQVLLKVQQKGLIKAITNKINNHFKSIN